MKRIAITINTQTLERTWNNGLYQNIHALVNLLLGTKKYEIVLLASSFDRTAETYSLANPGIRVVSYSALKANEFKLDVILEVGYAIDGKDLRLFRKNNKQLKIAKVSYGNTYMISQEYLVRPNSKDSLSPADAPRDALWSSPHYDFSRDWEALLRGTPIARQAPYIWSPTAIEIAMRQAKVTSKNLHIDKRQVAVLAPNLNVLKTCTIPIAIAEILHRKSPGSLKSVNCFNGHKLIENETAQILFTHMTMVRDQILSFDKRQSFVNIFSKYSGTLLTHQHYNALNYTYLEALYLGIPLVHNSPYFKDAGYYYEEFDIHTGATRLEEAVASEDLNYKEAAKEYVFQHSPENPKNIQGYVDLIEELFSQ